MCDDSDLLTGTFLSWLICMCAAVRIYLVLHFVLLSHLRNIYSIPDFIASTSRSVLHVWETTMSAFANLVKIPSMSKQEGESVCGKRWRITSSLSWLGSMCTQTVCVCLCVCKGCFYYSRLKAAPGQGWQGLCQHLLGAELRYVF